MYLSLSTCLSGHLVPAALDRHITGGIVSTGGLNTDNSSQAWLYSLWERDSGLNQEIDMTVSKRIEKNNYSDADRFGTCSVLPPALIHLATVQHHSRPNFERRWTASLIHYKNECVITREKSNNTVEIRRVMIIPVHVLIQALPLEVRGIIVSTESVYLSLRQ